MIEQLLTSGACLIIAASLSPSMAQMPLPKPKPEMPASPVGEQANDERPKDVIEGCIARLALKGIRVEATSVPKPVHEGCTIETPVRLVSVTGANGIIDFADRPLLACTFAGQFADFVQHIAAPLAVGNLSEPLAVVGTGPGYECRPRNHVAGAKLSAHGDGQAVDIASLRLKSGKVVSVEHPADDRQKDLLRGLRAAACGAFHTVIGPGADDAHANHIHIDVEERGRTGNAKLCQ